MEKSHVVYYQDVKYSYDVKIVGTEPLVNDYGTGYGAVMMVKRVYNVPDHLVLGSARDLYSSDSGDVWNQTYFRMVD